MRNQTWQKTSVLISFNILTVVNKKGKRLQPNFTPGVILIAGPHGSCWIWTLLQTKVGRDTSCRTGEVCTAVSRPRRRHLLQEAEVTRSPFRSLYVHLTSLKSMDPLRQSAKKKEGEKNPSPTHWYIHSVIFHAYHFHFGQDIACGIRVIFSAGLWISWISYHQRVPFDIMNLWAWNEGLPTSHFLLKCVVQFGAFGAQDVSPANSLLCESSRRPSCRGVRSPPPRGDWSVFNSRRICCRWVTYSLQRDGLNSVHKWLINSY